MTKSDVERSDTVYRVVTSNGEIPYKFYGSNLKRLYYTLKSANLAKKHYGSGAYVEKGTVTWEKVQ